MQANSQNNQLKKNLDHLIECHIDLYEILTFSAELENLGEISLDDLRENMDRKLDQLTKEDLVKSLKCFYPVAFESLFTAISIVKNIDSSNCVDTVETIHKEEDNEEQVLE